MSQPLSQRLALVSSAEKRLQRHRPSKGLFFLAPPPNPPTPCCIISATHRSKRCQFGCVIQQISASSWELTRSGNLHGPNKLAPQDLKRSQCHISSNFLNPALMRSMKVHILLLLGLHRAAPSSAALCDQLCSVSSCSEKLDRTHFWCFYVQ